MKDIKLVVNGDGAVGKTSMLISFTTGSFPGDYIPTVFDNYSSNLIVDGVECNVGLWDTAGPEDYDRLRPLSYPQTDVFMVVFSCNSTASLRNIESKWIPEIVHHCPKTPIVLCCSKADLRDDEETKRRLMEHGREMVTLDEARELVSRYPEVIGVVENSALTQAGLKDTFDFCTRVALMGDTKFPFKYLNPFEKGDWVYVHIKSQKNLAIIREKSDTYMKVYFFDRPYWFNSYTVKKRADIEPVDSSVLMNRVFYDFQPFGLEIVDTIIDHIAEYLPSKIFWSSRNCVR